MSDVRGNEEEEEEEEEVKEEGKPEQSYWQWSLGNGVFQAVSPVTVKRGKVETDLRAEQQQAAHLVTWSGKQVTLEDRAYCFSSPAPGEVGGHRRLSMHLQR